MGTSGQYLLATPDADAITGIWPTDAAEQLLSGVALRQPSPSGSAPIAIRVLRAVHELPPYASGIRALNEASRRPSPFQTPEYLAAYELHPEHDPRGGVLVLLAMRDGALIGCLPLRRVTHPKGRWLGHRIEFLTKRDADRPDVMARPEDAVSVAEAMLRHLVEHERGWSQLVLAEQDAESALACAAERVFGSGGYLLRRYPNNSNATVVYGDGGFPGWFKSLSADQRSKTSRRVRALFEEGNVELVVASDKRAVAAWLDVYLDIERRSWKAAAHAGISRHPDRIAFFRTLFDRHQPAEPSLLFLVREGLPIAGFLTLRFGDRAYGLEMAFDDGDAELAPGNVLMLLTIQDAAARGAASFNLLGNFAYHKMRWKALVTETAAIEVYRHGTPVHVKALLGDLRRRVFGGPTSQDTAGHNLTKAPVEGAAPDAAAHDPSVTRAIVAQAQVRTLSGGGRVERFAGEALASRLPFSVPGLMMKGNVARAVAARPAKRAAAGESQENPSAGGAPQGGGARPRSV